MKKKDNLCLNHGEIQPFQNKYNKLKQNKMDLMGMMGKLKETQQKMEEAKNRLNNVLVDEQSNDGLLQVTLTANREIKNFKIADELLQDKEMLEDYLVTVLNKAITKATNVNEAEMAAVAQSGMPNIPGLDMLR